MFYVHFNKQENSKKMITFSSGHKHIKIPTTKIKSYSTILPYFLNIACTISHFESNTF